MGRTCEDLTGQLFGNWTALKRIKRDTKTYYLCQCSCGNIKEIRSDNLKNGRSKSCGLCTARFLSKHDLRGQQFYYLTVLDLNYELSEEKGRAYYDVQCKCGNFATYRASQLLNGNAKSCGCMKSSYEFRVDAFLKEMDIEFQRQYTFQELKDTKKLPFDFAIFNKNKLVGLIECNGKQHYYPIQIFGGEEALNKTQFHDQLKFNFCKEHNIPFLIIKYNENIEGKLAEWLKQMKLLKK